MHAVSKTLILFCLFPANFIAPSRQDTICQRERIRSNFRIVGYFNEGGAKTGSYRVKEIETSGAAKLLTHMDYAFGRVANNRCEIPNPDVALEQNYDSASSVDGTDDPDGAINCVELFINYRN